MVFQIAGVVVLPIIMMMVLGPPPEHLFTEEPEEAPPENIGDLFFAFFVGGIADTIVESINKIFHQSRRRQQLRHLQKRKE